MDLAESTAADRDQWFDRLIGEAKRLATADGEVQALQSSALATVALAVATDRQASALEDLVEALSQSH